MFMLESILNDPQLNSKAVFSIVLLPPACCYHFSFTFDATQFSDYLASHVIQIPWDSPLNPQALVSVNNTTYTIQNGYIMRRWRRAKIVHTEVLYDENDSLTRLLLYLDRAIVELAPTLKTSSESSVATVNDLCFKEMVQKVTPNHGNDMVEKIDALAVKFCDASVDCDSLSSLHVCMETIIDEGYHILERIDKAVLTEDLNLDRICGAFESYIMDLTYDVVFFKITQFLLPQDKKLSVALEDMEHLDFSQVGLPASIRDERKRVRYAIAEFERIGSFRTPAEKLDCLLNTVSELTRDTTYSMAGSTFLDSDSLIPLLLMTLIRSKVPHLTANLIYMKDYTFERNIVFGKYGYALSTFEGVLDYILREHADLSRVSTKNLCFWLAIQTGDIDQVRKYSHDYAHDTLDTNGNNALMIACIHGQAEIAAYLLQSPDQGSRNDQNSTPLICAIQSNSLDTVRVLLQDTNIRQTVNTVFDNAGNSAALYACSTNNIDLVKVLVERGGAQLDLAVSTTTRDSALHVAAGSDASLPFLLYIFHHTTNALHRRNSHGETVYHVCKNVDFAKYLLNQVVSAKQTMIKSIDTFGRSPIMTWAAKGRLDLVELLISDLNTEDCARVDRQGRTLLHLLASHLTKGLTYGGNSLDFIVSKLRSIIHVREWSHGSTALHLAAETSTLASMQSVNGAIEFIRTLVKYGAELDAVNDRDEHPINISRIPEIISCLDELYLPAHTNKYRWSVTRPWIESTLQSSEIYYIIISCQANKTESICIVKRRLQDFLFLQKELLYEMPELFLPSIQHMSNPVLFDLRPPPLALIDTTLTQLRLFMDWLQNHPVLRCHDLVLSFVRSTADLQRSMIRDCSFSRRRLLLEKISSDLPLQPMMNSKQEEYFIKYAQELFMPLKEHYLAMLVSIRKLVHTGQELERAFSVVAQFSSSDTMFTMNSLAKETIKICANVTFEKSYVSPWPLLINASQLNYSLIDGILMSLQTPFALINQRCELRERIESQKEVLRTSKGWHSLFSSKERKKRIEFDKDKVIQSMNELNHIDRQIQQSHRMISDELAHYQNVHAKQMIKTIRKYAKGTLQAERHKMHVLKQALYKWDSTAI